LADSLHDAHRSARVPLFAPLADHPSCAVGGRRRLPLSVQDSAVDWDRSGRPDAFGSSIWSEERARWPSRLGLWVWSVRGRPGRRAICPRRS